MSLYPPNANPHDPDVLEEKHLTGVDFWLYAKRNQNFVFTDHLPAPPYLTAKRPPVAGHRAKDALSTAERMLAHWFEKLPDAQGLVLTFTLEEDGRVKIKPHQCDDDKLLDLGFAALAEAGYRKSRNPIQLR